MAFYEITDEGSFSKILQKEGLSTITSWAFPKTVSIKVQNEYLFIYFNKKLITPQIPRALISLPSSTSDEDLFNSLSFMTEGTPTGTTDYVQNVQLTGTDLNFTAVGSAFGGSVDLSGISGSTDYVQNVALSGTDLNFTGVGLGFSGTIPLASLLASSIISNTVFVRTNGNDTTGLRERADLAFATPWAAVVAAQAGDTVIVYAGTYNNSNTIGANDVLVKNGVKVYCFPNVEINYTSTVGSNSPFWDQGVDIESEILGYANFRFENGISPDFQLWLTAPNSKLSVECNKLSMRRRIRCTNGVKLYIECHESVRCTYVQVLSIRLAPDTDMDFRLTAPDFYSTREDAGSDTDYSAIGLRDFGENGSIYMKFNRIHVGDAFFSTGYYFFSRNKCFIYFHYETMIYTADAAWDQNQKHLLIAALDNAEWDASMNMSHIGQWMRFGTRVAGIGKSRGRIETNGKHETTDFPLSFSRSTLLGLPLDSRLNIVFNLDVNSNFQGGNKDNGDYIRLNDCPEGVKLSGAVRHTCTEVDANIIHLFRLDDVGSPPFLKDLVIETQSDFIMDSVSATAVNVPCVNVASNKFLDSAKQIAIGEAITVNSEIKF